MYRLIIILFILTLNLSIAGQYKCSFEHYSTDNGLSHGSIVDIMRDSKGFIWISTWDGINRFDSYNFKTYKSRPGDDVNLSSNRVDKMEEDKFGCIWMKSYDNKIYRLNVTNESIEDPLNGYEYKARNFFISDIGDIWIHTFDNGVFRIQILGVNNFTVDHYCENTEKDKCLSSNNVIFLFEDNENNIWINSNKGVSFLKFDSGTKNVLVEKNKTSEELNQHNITKYYVLKQNIILSSTDNKIIIINIESNDLEVLDLPIKDELKSILLAENGNIYIGTNENGLYELNPLNKKLLSHKNSGYLKSVNKIYEDSYGRIWLETNANGVVKYDPLTKESKLFTQEVDVKPVRHIISGCNFYEDKNKVLWITLKGGGLGYYNANNDNLEYFYNKPGSPDARMSNFVPVFYLDSSNVIWLSTYNKGLEKITLLEERFHFFQPSKETRNGLANEVRTLFEDNYGFLWVATKEGIIYLLDSDYNVVLNVTSKYNMDKILVYSIDEDQNNNIWLGTKGNGLFKIERKNIQNFNISHYTNIPENENSLTSNDIYSVMADSKGRIWIGTYGDGLNLIDFRETKGYFKNKYNTFTGYPENCCEQIRQIKEDNKGNIWLATTEGLMFFNPDSKDIKFHRFVKIPHDKTSLGNNDIFCIHNDGQNNLWFGSQGGGLIKLDTYPTDSLEAKFINFSKKEGLHSDVILSIESDIYGNLWMSSENGIVQFDPDKKISRKYGESYGLHKTNFSEAASFKRKNNDICFGAFDGIYVLNPEGINEEKRKVNLELTSFQIFNKEIEPGSNEVDMKKSILTTKKIVLRYNQNFFNIGYVALDFRNNENINYAYILEGYDDQWHNVNNTRLASYTKVPPGKYIFKVKCDDPELYMENPKTLEIRILPPPWRTKWAYAFYLILMIVIVELSRRIILTIIRLRNNVIIEKELTNVRLKFFTNISHELRTPLTLILGPVTEIFRTERLSPKTYEYLKLIENNTKRMLRLINQLLEFRKIQHQQVQLKLSNVNVNLFVNEVCANFNELAKEKNIRYEVVSTIKNTEIWIDEEKIDTVLYNLLSNAFKFTPNGKSIKVLLESSDNLNGIKLSVIDEGVGIPENKREYIFKRFANISESKKLDITGTGIGLSLSKELVDLHKGDIYFESKEGIGTVFIVELKYGKDHFDSNKVKFFNQDDYISGDMPDIKDLPVSVDEYLQHEVVRSVKKGKILVVEDNIELRRFIIDQLKKEYDIEEANDGIEGYDKAVNTNPDLIISDVMMPKMDGLEMLSKIKHNFNISHIPVIILSSKSSIESKIEGLKYGADAYISKPFNSIYLKSQILNLLHIRRQLISKFSGKIKLVDLTDEDIVVTDKDGEFLEKLVGIIEENITSPDFKVEIISTNMGMGRTNFFNKVKGLTGLSPIDFINEIRLNKAAKLIKTGNYNVSEVSYLVGFNDPGYFSKCFKEKFNISPSKYKDQ